VYRLCLACLLACLGSALTLRAQDSRVALGPWSGALTPDSAIVKAKLRRDGYEAFLLVDTRADFSRPRRFGPVTSATTNNDVVTFHLTGLKPDTAYHYVLEIKDRRELSHAGRLRTFPDRPQSFQFAFASCGRTGSTNASYECIRRHDPLFFLCTGDFHYEDIRTNRVEKFWRAYDKVFASPVQARLYREVPLVYVWDDHDYCGNNSDDRAPARSAVHAAYDTYHAHYPLLFSGPEAPITQSFEVGRIKFLVTDLRSQRDPSSALDGPRKTLLGRDQKQWLMQELLAAKGRYPVIFWVSPVPWNGTTLTNHYWPVGTNDFGFIHHTQLDYTPRTNLTHKAPTQADSWAAYATERREIADFIRENDVQGVILLHGDMHALAADDGSHTGYATAGGPGFPVFAAAPLDREASIKGGPYSAGVYKPEKGEGCFGLVDVQDNGRRIRVHYSGRNNQDMEVIHLDVEVPAPTQR
jgi:phosphodiesterase/alkaline phosphatase D-like protein